MNNTDHCFVCGIEFEASYSDGPKDWPSVIFEATGNWGSTVFDPMHPAKLSIRICDKCVLSRRDRLIDSQNHLPDSLRDDVEEFYKNK
jgi:hypothetical protein